MYKTIRRIFFQKKSSLTVYVIVQFVEYSKIENKQLLGNNFSRFFIIVK